MRKMRFLRKIIKIPHTKTAPKNIIEIGILLEKRLGDVPCQRKARIIQKISRTPPLFQKLYLKARIWKRK